MKGCKLKLLLAHLESPSSHLLFSLSTLPYGRPNPVQTKATGSNEATSNRQTFGSPTNVIVVQALIVRGDCFQCRIWGGQPSVNRERVPQAPNGLACQNTKSLTPKIPLLLTGFHLSSSSTVPNRNIVLGNQGYLEDREDQT